MNESEHDTDTTPESRLVEAMFANAPEVGDDTGSTAFGHAQGDYLGVPASAIDEGWDAELP